MVRWPSAVDPDEVLPAEHEHKIAACLAVEIPGDVNFGVEPDDKLVVAR